MGINWPSVRMRLALGPPCICCCCMSMCERCLSIADRTGPHTGHLASLQFWWCLSNSREARQRGYWHWALVHLSTCSQRDLATWQCGVYWHWPSAAWHLDA